MAKVKRYKVLSKHPNDEFIDLQVGVKLDSYQVVRFLNELYNYIEELRKENRKLTEELDKEYSLTDKMEFNDFSCMGIPNAVYNKLGELEDVLEKYKIENLEEYISALNEARNFTIKEHNAMFSKYIKETIKTEELETELTELKQKAIVPKFQANQEIWYYHIGKNKIYSGIIEDIQW